MKELMKAFEDAASDEDIKEVNQVGVFLKNGSSKVNRVIGA